MISVPNYSHRWHPYIIVVVVYVYLRMFKGVLSQIGLFVGGFVMCVLMVGYYVLNHKVVIVTKPPTTYHFKFLNKDHWNQELAQLSANKESLNEPIVQESFLISETLEELISLILQEFIDSWYTGIIKDQTFQQSIRVELKYIFKQLRSRVSKLDVSKLLVTRIMPIVNDHLLDYARAEERVQAKVNASKTTKEHINHDMDVARQYRHGKIHPGVTISRTDNDTNEKQYLRLKIQTVLPLVLSQHESTNDITLSLVREILACTVLANVVQLMGEGDFYNLLIVKLIGDNLKRRDQVKKLRAALDEHTKHNYVDKDVNKNYIITENMDIISYNDCLEKITHITSIDELKQLRVYLSLQLLTPHNDQGFLARIKEVQGLVEQRIAILQQKQNITLNDMLHNPVYLQEFRTFLQNQRKADLLEFWLAVNNLKPPLGDDDKLSLSLGFSNSQQINDIYSKFAKLGLTSKIQDYIESQDLVEKAELYKQASEELFSLQQEAFGDLEIAFKRFLQTDEYSNLIKTPDTGSTTISPIVIQAVEDAFTQIMKNNEAINKFEPDKHVLETVLKRDLFGDIEGSSLFDDFSDESGTDADSIISNNLHTSLELIGPDMESESDGQASLVLAAPGNLKLTEEITNLTDDISRLSEQQNILLPLMKKAELTNNLSELKILKNSKASLEREINIKELQKQQYIVQENDNSLYGKTTVKIQSYVNGQENGKEFVLYIIEVQKYSNDSNTAGWIIARRYNQFYKLNEYLKARYSEVGELKFPKRTVFKLQERQVVELRKSMLEEYLDQLIRIPEVCSNKVFRSFLSSENFDLRNHNDNKELISNMFYGISKKPKPKIDHVEINHNLKEMEKELKSFDEKEMFIKPIIDILVTVFKLKNSKNWIRGRALIVILQQIFGTTIENKIHDQIHQLVQEEKILDVLETLKNTIFPNGKFKDPPIIRSNYEKANSREEASGLLSIFMKDTFTTIFGMSNTRYAYGLLFNVLQNDFLVKHLMFEILDQVFNEIFPEIVQP